MFHYTKAVLRAIPRLVMTYLFKLKKYGKHPDKYPRAIRFATMRKLSDRILRALGAKIQIFGLENLPDSNFCMVSNHMSMIDPLPFMVNYDKPLTFVGKKELMDMPMVPNDFKSIEGEYIDYTKHLRHFYLPIIPKFGMNGLFMALGMNVYFLRKRLPFRARWGCLSKNIFKHIEEMLVADIPVVLAAGPNWPNLFGKHRLNMYEFLGGQYVVTASMRAHYVTVTAMDDEYMTISSWGKKFSIKRDEFMEYAGKHSNFLFSSILVIKAGK